MSEQLTKEQIKIGRLLKKIEKLKQQRDHFKGALEHYQYVLNIHPAVLSRYNTLTRMVAEQDKNRANAKRVVEQEALIERMLKEEKERNDDTGANFT